MTQRLSVLALVLDVWKFTFFVSNMQEIGVLVTLFCLFHACVGLILPSLARLRTMYAKLSVLSLNFGSTYQKKKKKKNLKCWLSIFVCGFVLIVLPLIVLTGMCQMSCVEE
jgi:hypothetical protein